MGLNFRKSIKFGPARINLSKSGVGYSVGAGGLRYTKSPKRKSAKKKLTLSECIGYLFGIIIFFFIVAAVVSLIVDFIVRYKWVFITIGILALAGVIAYIVIAHRKIAELNKREE
jgi:membrane protein YdbS with pleckstrin-like domain